MSKLSSRFRSQPVAPASPTPDMIQRQSSESGTQASGSKKWGIRLIKKKPSNIFNTSKGWSNRSTENESHDSLGIRTDTGSSIIHENDSNHRQLRDILQRVRSGPTGSKDVDGAYDGYSKYKDRANALCYAILHEEFKPKHASTISQALDGPRRGSSIESPGGFDQRSSFSGRSLTEVVTGSAGRSSHINESGFNAVREWRLYLESLAEWFKTNLSETYRKFEHEATPEMVEALFTSKRFRREAVHRMRNASVTRVMSADPQFFPRYEIRFRNYERIKSELAEIRSLVQSGESGISPDRKIQEIVISPHGDAILEFANVHLDATGEEPVLRFRVSSSLLSETSPIFARMFSGHTRSLYLHDDEDITAYLPQQPTRYICRDGSEAKLFRMPQFEPNVHQAMEILLHAAHMQNEKVPREVSFEQFVAIAECSMRYKSTSPLEMVVEHRWLPQWMHKGADDMPDGMLAISYAFGLRSIFTRMSKSAILNLVDERDLQNKPWPQKIKDKIWAFRSAKVAQVHECCISTIQEYIRPPSRNPADEVEPVRPSDIRNSHWVTSTAVPKPAAAALSTTPRCPKGSHWCDAGNLGWMMLVYNELNLLSQVVRPNVMTHLPDSAQQPSRSLAQVVEALRRAPSPASPIHRGGVCDPSATFRAAVNDIFNSVSGLTLYDVSGKSHGWALSKHHESEPQETMNWGLNRMAVNDRSHHGVATEFPEHIRLKVLSYVDDLDDLHAAAMANGHWYDTYKTHELYLMRNILRAGRIRSNTEAFRQPILPKSISNAEEKVPKEVSDELKVRERGDGADAMTLRSEDDESDFDDNESIEGTPAPSITESLWRETRLRQARTRLAEQALGRRTTSSPPYIAPPPDLPPPTLVDSSSTTPRQSPPPEEYPKDGTGQPSVTYTEYIDEPPLTDEEARRILWGDDDSSSASPPASAPPPEEGLREKFRFGDKSFTEGVEEKSLLTSDSKKLLNEKRNGGSDLE